MKTSFSSIAWDKKSDGDIYSLLAEKGFDGIDVIPSMIGEPEALTQKLNENKLIVGGMQSLLFGHPECTIFENEPARTATLNHLSELLVSAGKLGVSGAIFGSPKNRIMGEQTSEKWNIAHEFFLELGKVALEHKTALCLEPNPTSYGTDFLTATKDTFEFVKSINHPGLRVNLDTGTMIMNGENPTELIENYFPYIGHVHFSEPNLTPLTDNPLHKETFRALKNSGYQKWIAIEMKQPTTENLPATLREAIATFSSIRT